MTDRLRDLLISLTSHMAYMQGQLEARHELDDPEDFYWYRESVALRQKVTDALAQADGPAVPEGREPASVVSEPSDRELLEEGPSLEEVEELCEEHCFNVEGYESIECLQGLINDALARWGANQELEACCWWLNKQRWEALAIHLRAARRPEPPSLKEQALAVVENSAVCDHLSPEHEDILRRALEQLDD